MSESKLHRKDYVSRDRARPVISRLSSWDMSHQTVILAPGPLGRELPLRPATCQCAGRGVTGGWRRIRCPPDRECNMDPPDRLGINHRNIFLQDGVCDVTYDMRDRDRTCDMQLLETPSHPSHLQGLLPAQAATVRNIIHVHECFFRFLFFNYLLLF
jgi:hypothetical protein